MGCAVITCGHGREMHDDKKPVCTRCLLYRNENPYHRYKPSRRDDDDDKMMELKQKYPQYFKMIREQMSGGQPPMIIIQPRGPEEPPTQVARRRVLPVELAEMRARMEFERMHKKPRMVYA